MNQAIEEARSLVTATHRELDEIRSVHQAMQSESDILKEAIEKIELSIARDVTTIKTALEIPALEATDSRRT